MRPFGTTIFSEMSALAVRTGSVNLGQGFPDTDGPPEMLAAAAEALRSGANQYPPLSGIPALRAAIVAHEQRFWGLTVDPDTEVVVTAGATEAIAATILALCEAGDEVVCFEPYYDSYAASIALAGAVRRPVTLRPGADGRYGFDEAELRAAFGPRTRLVLLNSPHNPTGKVFTRAELSLIARLSQEHDVYAVTDEVYEHLVFTDAPEPHLPLAALPGMRERTVRISSAGKTFSCTGWKIGWATGPAALISAVLRGKQFLTFVNGAPLQPAVAVAPALPHDYFEGVRAGLQAPPPGGGGRVGAARGLLRGVPRGPAGPPRPARRRPVGRGLRRAAVGGHLLRHGRHPAAGRHGRHRLLPRAARARGRRGRAHPGL